MTQTITIDGPTLDLDDGSTVCIGYYEDAEGRVVDRFAVPPGTHSVPAAVDSIEFVRSLDDLPQINERYRTPP